MKIYPSLWIVFQCFTCLVFSTSTAQEAEKWTNYTVNEGLLDNYIECIHEDQLGFLWIGTWSGISRFDGREFCHYRKNINDSLSLPGNRIYCIYEDKLAHLWVGTDEGLAIYYRSANKFKRIHTVRGHAIVSISEDNKGNIWAAGDQHIYQVDARNNKLMYYNTLVGADKKKPIEIGAIAVSKQNVLWIGTSSQGLFKLKLDKNELSKYHDPSNILDQSHIKVLKEDQDGSIWIATLNQGLFRLEADAKNELKNYKTDPKNNLTIADNLVRTIYMDGGKNLWFLNTNGFTNKLFKDHFERIEIKSELIQSNDKLTTRCMLIDRNGNEWIGTHGNGLLNRNRQKEKFHNFAGLAINKTSNKIASFMELDSNRILVGTDGGGLYTFNRKDYVYKPVLINKAYAHAIVLCIQATNTNIFLALWRNGLLALDKNTLQVNNTQTSKLVSNKNAGNLDLKWIINKDSLLWLASSGEGVFTYNIHNGLLTSLQDMVPNNYDLPKWCNHIMKDRKNRTWISTDKGLFLLKNNQLIKFKSTENSLNAINSNLITCTYEDSKGSIWVLTDEGLQQFIENGLGFSNVTQPPLQGQQLKAIVEDRGGNLWISSNNGLVCYNTLHNTTKLYTTGNGLPGNFFCSNAALQTRDGYLLFGGLNGFTYFHPDSLNTNHKVDKSIFTDVQLNFVSQTGSLIQGQNQSKVSNTMTLPYSNQILTFKFTSIDLCNVQNIRYAYQLTNQDTNWVEIGSQNYISFTNLAPGKYELKVLAKNLDGTTSSPSESYFIEILPPWYLSTWAYLFYGVIFLMILYIIYYVLTLRLRTKNKLILQRFEHSKKLELYKSKIDFFTSVSHDIRTPLTLIMAPLELLRTMILDNKEAIKMLNVMDKNAQSLLTLTNELLAFKNLESGERKLHLEQIDLSELVQTAVACFVTEAQIKNIALQVSIEPCGAMLDKHLINKVLNNLLVNAFKFTPAHGSIQVNLQRLNNEISISIFNSGSAISKEVQSKIFDPFYTTNNEAGFGLGLAIVKEIVTLHKGKIKIINQDNGVTFTLLLPKKMLTK